MTSKADQLAGSAAFANARAAGSRRATFEASIGGGADEAASDLPITVISNNPDNPRDHLRNLEETEDSVRQVGVLLPIVVATVDAYLAKRPHRQGDVQAGASHIVVDGHRRLEAARRVGLATIPVRVDDARVATDETLLEAAFIANYHRDDMTELEEANALQQLVTFYGNQKQAAKRLGIPTATLSTKLSLLKLSPELQADLVTGVRRVEHVRNLGKLSPEEQRAKADERAATADRRRSAPVSAVAPTPAPEPTSASTDPVEPKIHGVNSEAEPPRGPAASVPAPAAPPRDRKAQGDEQATVRVVERPKPDEAITPVRQDAHAADGPWENWEALAEEIIKRMKPDHVRRLTVRLIAFNTDQAEAADAAARVND